MEPTPAYPPRTLAQNTDQPEKATDKTGDVNAKMSGRYQKELTVVLDVVGGDGVTAMALIKATAALCGQITALRMINKDKFEITVVSEAAKTRLLEGFCIGGARVHARDINQDELIVSFMGLPAYIDDDDIIAKLMSWGVTAVSTVRRRMWPGTGVADGTRFVKVRFTESVKSLPYSVRFNTAAGPEYFRVIHDRQVRVCRGCLSPDHVLRECPDFLCRKCGGQGHYARECTEQRAPRCKDCGAFSSVCTCTEEEDAGSERMALDEEEEGESGGQATEGRETALSSECKGATGEEKGVAPAREGEVEAAPLPIPGQGEDSRSAGSPKAAVALAEAGRRMGVAIETHLISEGQGAAQGGGRDSRPGGDQQQQERGRPQTRAHSKSGLSQTRGGRALSAGMKAPMTEAAGSKLPVRGTPAAKADTPPGAVNTPHTDPLLLSDEMKKRQLEETNGKGPTKKKR